MHCATAFALICINHMQRRIDGAGYARDGRPRQDRADANKVEPGLRRFPSSGPQAVEKRHSNLACTVFPVGNVIWTAPLSVAGNGTEEVPVSLLALSALSSIR